MEKKMRKALLATCLSLTTVAVSAQSLAYPDSLKTDTLREITIEGNKEIKLPMSNGLKSSIQDIVNAEKYSLGGILDRYAPMAKDYIMHPFGFAERKRARKRQKVNKVLNQYDAITDPLQELLDSVANVRGTEPEK